MSLSFRELLAPIDGFSPGQLQEQASKRFPNVVEYSHVEIWLLNDSPFEPHDQDVLIGVATYSLEDLKLLDEIAQRLRVHSAPERISVFDISAFTEMGDFERLLPGIGKVFQTPVVGFWRNGHLTERLSGAAARDWLVERYMLSQLAVIPVALWKTSRMIKIKFRIKAERIRRSSTQSREA